MVNRSYSDKPQDPSQRSNAEQMAEAIKNFKGPVTKCKEAMPKKKRNPVGGR